MMKIKVFMLSLAATLVLSGLAFAQGTQSAILRGSVKMPSGDPVPGVTVTVTSTALQGQRSTVTGAGGDYVLRGLPPGIYNVTFELEGMSAVGTEGVELGLGATVELDASMQVLAQQETIVVTGEIPSVLASSQVATSYDFDKVNSLPIGTDPDEIAVLAPGLTTNTPNDYQVHISGGFAYDNVFLIDGVDANDNLFGTVNFVYIEDAIADTQVLTSGISAEYGRFSGGVINIITKTGGNEFAGTLRAELTNDAWRSRTPLEVERGTELQSNINEIYMATLGGFILKDKLWFFGAARDSSVSTTDSFNLTGLPRTATGVQDRFELKLTGNIRNKHQLVAQSTERDLSSFNSSFTWSATPDTLTTTEYPSTLQVLRYSGVWTPSVFGEAQYSQKEFGFRREHTFREIERSPMIGPGWYNIGTRIHYNSPYFDGTDPEDRNNEQLTANVSFFRDTPRTGSHDLKVGFEDFTSTLVGGNSQTTTDWVFWVDPVVDAQGQLVLDADNKLIPDWLPFGPLAIEWFADRGATIDINTQSFFVNDRWNLNDHWSFNIGFRYEQVDSEATGNIVTVDTDRLVPRLGATYDLKGDGRYRFDVTYAEYSGKYSESQFANNTTVGNAAYTYYVYIGPPGQGLDFAPAMSVREDLSNWWLVGAFDGTQNVFLTEDIQSPVVDEITLAAGMELGRGGYLKLVYTDRSYSDFIEDFLCTGPGCPGPGDTGTTDMVVEGVEVGTFNNNVYANSNIPVREYEALQLLGRYRITNNWSVEGHWTYQLNSDGNFEGENTNQPGISSIFGDFPQIFDPQRHYPVGRVNDTEEHRVLAWTTYNLDLGRAGGLGFGLLGWYSSGTTYSIRDNIGFTAIQRQILDDLGYFSFPGSSQTVYFADRGTEDFPSWYRFDLSVNYTLPIWRSLDVWLKADVINILGSDKQIDWNPNFTAIADGPVDALGIPTTYEEASNFGDPIDNDSYVLPREYRFTVGFRF